MAMRSGAEFGWRALIGWIHSYGMLHSTPLDLYRLVPDGYGFLFTTLGKKDSAPPPRVGPRCCQTVLP
jgi:hypothetical protein